MPRIQPFRAIRPTPQHAESVASVPYDVVNRDEAAQLAEGNPQRIRNLERYVIDAQAFATSVMTALENGRYESWIDL